MKALITGGAGFIGSTLADRLLSEGAQIVVVDNLATGYLSNLEQAKAKFAAQLAVHEIDIRSDDVVELIKSTKPDVVYHLAAQMDVRVSVAQPKFDADVNVMGSLNVLEAARVAQVKKFVFASSGGTIYGAVENTELPVHEKHLREPLSPYGITKSVFGDYLRAYSEMYGVGSVALALANVYGPRQDPHGEAGVVAIFAGRMLKGDQCRIFGDGEATRDYAYVDDVVDAFVRAATKGNGLYNIGNGVEVSTNMLYKTIAEAVGIDSQPEYAPARVGELQRSSLDNRRARADLGWTPQVDFAEGARRVVEFFRNK